MREINLGRVKGDDATINGYNIITITDGVGVTVTQNGTSLTIAADTDSTPTENSSKPVTSGGVYTAIDGITLNSLGAGSAAVLDAPASGNAGNTEVVLGSDSRLTDSRNAADVYSWAKAETKPTYTASEVGAIDSTLKGAVNGVAELDSNGLVPASQLPSFVDDVRTGTASGVTETAAGTYSATGFTLTGESTQAEMLDGVTYVDTTSNIQYRWTGTDTNLVSMGSNLALGETNMTAYRGDRGKTAYDHSQSAHARVDATKTEASSTNGNIKIDGTETTVYTHPGSGTNPHGTTKSDVGLGNVGNFKAVSTEASQGLTDTEKANARANIGAGDSSFSGNYNDLNNKPTLGTAAALNVAETGNAGDTEVVKGNDTRLTDARNAADVSAWAKEATKPSYTAIEVGAIASTEKGANGGVATLDSTGKLPSSQLPTLGTAAAKDVATTGNASTTQVVMGNDTRLTDARNAADVYSWAKASTKPSYDYSEIGNTPTLGTAAALNVAATGNAGDTEVVKGNDSRLSDSRTPVAHTHTKSEITDFPTLGTASAKDVPSSGNATSTQVVMGNDSRLSDARTPVSHTHGNIQNGGTLQTTDVSIANGDKLVITDASDGNKVARTSASFDGSTTTKCLTQKGTFETFGTSNLAIGTTGTTAAAGNHTHATSIATSSGTNQLSLAANTKYAISAGGTSYVFTTPPDTDTTYSAGTGVGIDANNAISVSYGTAAGTACQGNDSRLSDARTPVSHTHGNIQNGGTLQTSDITIANGDKLVVTDSSDSNKVARASIAFDGSTTNKCLTQKGTWEAFTNTSGTVTSVKVGTTSYNPSSGVVSLPAYPTTLPASDTVSTYSSTGTAPVNGTAVAAALATLPSPMVFKGSLGTGGTITALPVNGTATIGDTYKVITAGTYASQAAKVGDMFICTTKTSTANTWTYIPSADEPSGTVTSVTLKATSPIAIDSSSAITTSGTRTLSHANSGATAGSYGDSAAQTPAYGATFKVPYVTVNATGHVTAISEHTVKIPASDNTDTSVTEVGNHYTPTADSGSQLSASATGATAAWSIDVVKGVTLDRDAAGHVTGISVTSGKIPANPNTDTKLRQTLSTTNKNYPLLMSYAESTNTTGNVDNVSYRANAIYANPSTGNIQATKLNGVDIGSSPKFTDTTYSAGTGVGIDANNAISVSYGTAAGTACQGNDSRLSDARTPVSHTHGNIQNGGTLQTSDITIANGDKLVVTDSSDSNKVARASISFDGSTTTQCLTKKGTWATFGTSNLAIGTTASTAAAGNHTHTLSIATSSGTNQISLAANTKYVLTGGGSTYVFTTPKDTTYSAATQSAAGLMSAADKKKLDGMAHGSIPVNPTDTTGMNIWIETT